MVGGTPKGSQAWRPSLACLTGDRAPLLLWGHPCLGGVDLGVLQGGDHLAAEQLDRPHRRLVRHLPGLRLQQ